MLPIAVVVVSIVLCLSHVYAVADAAFQQSQASTQEQCIIIRYISPFHSFTSMIGEYQISSQCELCNRHYKLSQMIFGQY